MARSSSKKKLRESILAGIFYPEDATALASAVDRALGSAPDSATGGASARAILTPHAAFDYCSSVQAAAWKSAGGRNVTRVIMLCSYQRTEESAVYLPESMSFQCPLGPVTVDTDFCTELESCSTIFRTNDIPHLEEHGIEVQLPFMKRMFPEAKLVPLVISGCDPSALAGLSRALDLLITQDPDGCLVVSVSNLASSIMAADASMRSDELVRMLLSSDWRALCALGAEYARSDGRACSIGPMALPSALSVLKGCHPKLLARVDSTLRREHSTERVVQYAAMGWFPPV
ncbi:MAG TPA: AmmeMemoRadiSam system protein B [Spirochaetales bacterium]|nr:AmmeMemoRadiSam system protein B [Spirochaetales bacterium]